MNLKITLLIIRVIILILWYIDVFYIYINKLYAMTKKLQTKEYGISTLKGMIGAIPFAGTFLNEVAFEARSRIKQERVNRFVAFPKNRTV